MTWKKTWFNYLIGCVFILGVCSLLSESFIYLIYNIDKNIILNYNSYLVIGGLCLALLVVRGLIFVISRIANNARAKLLPSTTCAFSWIVIGLSFIFGVVVRILLIWERIPENFPFEDLDFIGNALVGNGGFFFDGNLEKFGLSGILYGVFSFLGNRAYISIYVLLALWMIGCIFIVLAVKNISGHFGASVCALLLLILPGQLYFSIIPHTFALYYCVFGICLFWLSVIYKAINGNRSVGTFISAFLWGIVTAILIYDNFFGVLLFVVAISLFFARKFDGKTSKIATALICVLTVLATYGALTYFFGIQRGLVIPTRFEFIEEEIISLDAVIILIISFAGLFGYLSSKFDDYSFCGMLLMVASLSFLFFSFYRTEYFISIFAYFGMVIAAGMLSESWSILGDQLFVKNTDDDLIIEDISDEPMVEEPVFEEPVFEEPVVEEAVAEETVAEEPVEEKPKVKFFDSPIPLPKKHEAKTVDYDHEFSASILDDYDIAVDDNDDFDIKD